MPGFVSSISNNNEAVFANNADFSGSTDPSELNGLQTNGQLWVGSTALNAGSTHVNVGRLTSPLGTLNVGYTSPNITVDLASTPGTTCIFSANLSATVSNVTGDGTLYNIIFDQVFVNTGSAYNSATGVFTTPTTGNYQFNTTVYMEGLTVAHTEGIILLRGSSKDLRPINHNFGAVAQNGTNAVSGSCMLTMTVGETLFVTVYVANGAKVVDVIGAGGAPDLRTVFSGYLIP